MKYKIKWTDTYLGVCFIEAESEEQAVGLFNSDIPEATFSSANITEITELGY